MNLEPENHKPSKVAVWLAALVGLLLVDFAVHAFVFEQSNAIAWLLLIPGLALVFMAIRWAKAGKDS